MTEGSKLWEQLRPAIASAIVRSESAVHDFCTTWHMGTRTSVARAGPDQLSHFDGLFTTLLGTPMNSHEGRHLYYQQHLLPNVATRLGFDHRREYQDIDFVMFDDGHPVVAVEIENEPRDANEIVQLVKGSAPLGVLILTLEWHAAYGAKQKRHRFLPSIEEEIRRCASPGNRADLFALIVGEWRSLRAISPDEAEGTVSLYYRLYDPKSGRSVTTLGAPTDPQEPDALLFRARFVSHNGVYRRA